MLPLRLGGVNKSPERSVRKRASATVRVLGDRFAKSVSRITCRANGEGSCGMGCVGHPPAVRNFECLNIIEVIGRVDHPPAILAPERCHCKPARSGRA